MYAKRLLCKMIGHTFRKRGCRMKRQAFFFCANAQYGLVVQTWDFCIVFGIMALLDREYHHFV